MKTLAAFLLAFVFVIGAAAQDEQLSKKELRKLQKEQRKAEQAALEEQAAMMTKAMVTGQRFVLEAEFLSNREGSRVPVQSIINFVMVDSLTGTLQLGSAMEVGYNGVGGSTLEGQISNYQYTEIGRKKDSYSVTFNMMSSLGSYNITLMVNKLGNADCSIRGNWPGELNYHGKLVPLEQSRVYKGTPVY